MNNLRKRQALKIIKWLERQSKDIYKITLELYSNERVEIRVSKNALSRKPEITIYILDMIELFVDTKHITSHKQCCCKAELYDTLNAWYFKENKT